MRKGKSIMQLAIDLIALVVVVSHLVILKSYQNGLSECFYLPLYSLCNRSNCVKCWPRCYGKLIFQMQSSPSLYFLKNLLGFYEKSIFMLSFLITVSLVFIFSSGTISHG